MEDNIDQLIKRHLRAGVSKKLDLPSQPCPSELELCDYLQNRLSQEKESSLLDHIANCAHCLSLLEAAQAGKEKIADRPSPEMIMRAKNIAQEKHKKIILKQKWQIFAFISFVLSFVLKQYFLQFLVLAIIFSVKWIFDTGSTRSLIMIYEAWRKKDKGTAQKIIRDFENEITMKRHPK